MESIQNLVEYYDELFPVTESQKDFYHKVISSYPQPVKILRVSSGSGLLEHSLSKEGHDVTGIETSPELLKTSNLRRRTQLMSVRFFQMSHMDMTKFLCKGFYNIISNLEGRISFIRDKTLLEKFFFDCKQLLAENGVLILQVFNFEKYSARPKCILPTRESIRTTLFSELYTNENDETFLSMKVETGNGRILNVMKDEQIYPILPQEIEEMAEKAGFKSAEFYADYEMNDFTGDEDYYIVMLK